MVGSLYSGLIVLVDWLIKLFVFHKISGLKWEIKKDSAIAELTPSSLVMRG